MFFFAISQYFGSLKDVNHKYIHRIANIKIIIKHEYEYFLEKKEKKTYLCIQLNKKGKHKKNENQERKNFNLMLEKKIFRFTYLYSDGYKITMTSIELFCRKMQTRKRKPHKL